MTTPSRTWKYEYHHIRVVDGDTTVGNIDQGMNTWQMNQYIRFAGINAPERDTEEGQTAKDFLNTLMTEGTMYYLVTTEYHEFEKYGRVLAYIHTSIDDIDFSNPMTNSINESMLETGNAVVMEGSGKSS